MKSEKNLFVDFAVGGFAAGLSKTIVAPVERVKLLLQLQDTTKGLENSNKKYSGMLNCFTRVYAEQGFTSFWRGNLSNVIRYFPAQALNFTFKDWIKQFLPRANSKTQKWKSFSINLLSGGLAGAFSLVLIYPLDFIRTRLATDIGKSINEREFQGMGEVIRKVFLSDGIAGVYRGLCASITCAFVYRALYFGMFDSGKVQFFEDFHNANFFAVWGFAQFVTTFAGFFVYPLDTIRRSLMMQSGREHAKYLSSLDCGRNIFQHSGIRGFYNGAASNVVRGTGGALVLVIYNKIQAYFGFHAQVID